MVLHSDSTCDHSRGDFHTISQGIPRELTTSTYFNMLPACHHSSFTMSVYITNIYITNEVNILHSNIALQCTITLLFHVNCTAVLPCTIGNITLI